MEHYDLRIIDDCLVFSYKVECPNACKKTQCPPKRTSRSHRAEKRNARRQGMKSFLLHVLLIVLAPFAVLLDAVGKVVCLSAKSLLCVLRKRPVPARVIDMGFALALALTSIFTAR